MKELKNIRKHKVSKDSVNQEKSMPQNSLQRELFYLLLKIFCIVIVGIVMFTFLFGIFQYRELGMRPALKDGDLVIFYRLDKDYCVSDTAVIVYEGKKQIRRVVAVEGDVVDITEEGLTVNGALQAEQAIYEDTLRYVEGIDFPVTVGEKEIFVLGDSRETAVDSRIYGPVKIRETKGKVITIIRSRNL